MIEKGRYIIIDLERNQRQCTCPICNFNGLEDVFHYILRYKKKENILQKRI